MSVIRKPSIPAISQANTFDVLKALKENVEVITGVRTGVIKQLSTTATTAETIAKINEIIVRINATGV